MVGAGGGRGGGSPDHRTGAPSGVCPRGFGACGGRHRYDTDSERGYEVDLGGDEQDLARTILAAFEPWGPPSLVVCGDRSADRGTGALPGFLAHELGAAQALGLVSLEPDAATVGAARALVAERRLDGGWREQLRVPLPRCARWRAPASGFAGRRWPEPWRPRSPPSRWSDPGPGRSVVLTTLGRPCRSVPPAPIGPGPGCCPRRRATIPGSGCWP